MKFQKSHRIFKPIMLIQQHVFWKKEIEITHDMPRTFTVILLYEIFDLFF